MRETMTAIEAENPDGDNPWYADLKSPKDYYVKVELHNHYTNSTATVYGCLNEQGQLQIGNDYLQVLDYTNPKHKWERHQWVSAVTYLWDEHSYEMIATAKIQEGDYLLYEDRLCRIVSVEHKHIPLFGANIKFTFDNKEYTIKNYGGYSLRKRVDYELPGLYMDSRDRYCILNPEDSCWYECTPSLSRSEPEPDYKPYRLIAKLNK